MGQEDFQSYIVYMYNSHNYTDLFSTSNNLIKGGPQKRIFGVCGAMLVQVAYTSWKREMIHWIVCLLCITKTKIC